MQHAVHHGHRLLMWLGSIAAVLIVITGAGLWRLMAGPIELDRLIPYVQDALDRSGAGLGVAVSGVSIAIDRASHQLDFRLHNIRLAAPNGEKLANFPEMATSFSLGALLRGRIEPTRLKIDRPVLLLTRDAAGGLSFRVGDGGDADHTIGLADPSGILGPLRPGEPWSQLREVTVHDATIVIDDRETGRVWRANRVAATLSRSEAGVSGDLSFATEIGTTSPELHVTYRYGASDQLLRLDLAVDGLDPTALAPLSPILAPLAQARVSVAGTLDLLIDVAHGRVERGRVDLGFAAGQITTPFLVGGGLSIERGELHADYAPDKSQLRLQQLMLDLGGGAHLVVAGELDSRAPQLESTLEAWPDKLHGNLDVTLTHVPMGRVASLWPQGLSPGGRNWVAANLPEGMIDEMAMQFALTVDPAAQSVAVSGAHGTMRYHDLTVDYFDGLPPIKEVSGTAALTDRRLDFTVGSGALKSLKATGGTVSITDIGAPVETLTVDVGVSGPLREALQTLDSKPLHYAHDTGIDPARVAGKFDAQLYFKLPLLADLKLAAVDYAAKASFIGVTFTKIALDRNLSDGSFTLDLGRAGAHVLGAGKFDGSPATIDGTLFFHPTTGPRARYRIGIALDDAARQRLGWDAGNRLSGPIAADLTYTAPASGTHASVDAVLDLTAAHMALAEAGWEKPPLTPATAKLTVDLDNDVVSRVPQLDVKAPGLDGRFAVSINADNRRIELVDIRQLTVAGNDMAGVVSRRPGGGWRADLRCGRLDLSHVVKHALSDDTPETASPLQIDARIGLLSLGPHHEARDVSAALMRDRGLWEMINLSGAYLGGGKLSLTLSSTGSTDGARKLHFASNDLGSSLSLFGIADSVIGGSLTIDGTVSQISGHQVLRAHLSGADYNLVGAPVLARLLSLTSLDGLFGAMSGSGIPFTTLRGEVTYSQGRIALDRVAAYGGSLGITARGWVDPGADTMDVEGALAPAYVLNGMFSSVPVLGPLLIGGEGHGLFATSFRIAGPTDDPGVTVNPLSTLTPGVLRRLFDPIVGSPQMPPLVQQAQH